MPASLHPPETRAIAGPVPAVLAAVASGAALSLVFPSADQGWLAWIALVPLLLALRGRRLPAAAGLGAIFATTTAFGIFGWLFTVPALTLLQFTALAIYHSFYPVAWCLAVVLVSRGRVPLVLAAPALWAALETLHAHAGFLSLPWATLAQSQHGNLAVLQLAAWTGEAGLAFLIVMSNVAIAAWLAAAPGQRRVATRTALTALATIVAVHAAGAWALTRGDGERSLTVAAVQPGIGIDERRSAAGREAVWQRLVQLTQAADATGPAVIAWPETSVGDPRHDPLLAARLQALSLATRAALLVGAAETEKFAASSGDGAMTVAARANRNSAYLVEAGAFVGEPYRKRELLPFAEYLPLRGVVAWPHWLVPDIVDASAGDDSAPFVLHAGAGPAVRVAVLICWENLFASLSRQAVHSGADIIVQLTNDGWFGTSRAAAQHNAISVMRAVENGVPVLIASNAGPSQIIDAHGRVLARVDGRSGGVGVVATTLGVGGGGTIYTRYGDVFAWLCVAGAAVALVTPRLSRQRPLREVVPMWVKETI